MRDYLTSSLLQREFLPILTLADKGITVERRGRKTTDLREIPMMAGLPAKFTGGLWASDMEIRRAFLAIFGRFVAEGLPDKGFGLGHI